MGGARERRSRRGTRARARIDARCRRSRLARPMPAPRLAPPRSRSRRRGGRRERRGACERTAPQRLRPLCSGCSRRRCLAPLAGDRRARAASRSPASSLPLAALCLPARDGRCRWRVVARPAGRGGRLLVTHERNRSRSDQPRRLTWPRWRSRAGARRRARGRALVGARSARSLLAAPLVAATRSSPRCARRSRRSRPGASGADARSARRPGSPARPDGAGAGRAAMALARAPPRVPGRGGPRPRAAWRRGARRWSCSRRGAGPLRPASGRCWWRCRPARPSRRSARRSRAAARGGLRSARSRWPPARRAGVARDPGVRRLLGAAPPWLRRAAAAPRLLCAGRRGRRFVSLDAAAGDKVRAALAARLRRRRVLGNAAAGLLVESHLSNAARLRRRRREVARLYVGDPARSRGLRRGPLRVGMRHRGMGRPPRRPGGRRGRGRRRPPGARSLTGSRRGRASSARPTAPNSPVARRANALRIERSTVPAGRPADLRRPAMRRCAASAPCCAVRGRSLRRPPMPLRGTLFALPVVLALLSALCGVRLGARLLRRQRRAPGARLAARPRAAPWRRSLRTRLTMPHLAIALAAVFALCSPRVVGCACLALRPALGQRAAAPLVHSLSSCCRCSSTWPSCRGRRRAAAGRRRALLPAGRPQPRLRPRRRPRQQLRRRGLAPAGRPSARAAARRSGRGRTASVYSRHNAVAAAAAGAVLGRRRHGRRRLRDAARRRGARRRDPAALATARRRPARRAARLGARRLRAAAALLLAPGLGGGAGGAARGARARGARRARGAAGWTARGAVAFALPLALLPLLKLRLLALAGPLALLGFAGAGARRGARLAAVARRSSAWARSCSASTRRSWTTRCACIRSRTSRSSTLPGSRFALGGVGLFFDVAFGLFAAAPLWLLLVRGGVAAGDRRGPVALALARRGAVLRRWSLRGASGTAAGRRRSATASSALPVLAAAVALRLRAPAAAGGAGAPRRRSRRSRVLARRRARSSRAGPQPRRRPRGAARPGDLGLRRRSGALHCRARCGRAPRPGRAARWRPAVLVALRWRARRPRSRRDRRSRARCSRRRRAAARRRAPAADAGRRDRGPVGREERRRALARAAGPSTARAIPAAGCSTAATRRACRSVAGGRAATRRGALVRFPSRRAPRSSCETRGGRRGSSRTGAADARRAGAPTASRSTTGRAARRSSLRCCRAGGDPVRAGGRRPGGARLAMSAGWSRSCRRSAGARARARARSAARRARAGGRPRSSGCSRATDRRRSRAARERELASRGRRRVRRAR